MLLNSTTTEYYNVDVHGARFYPSRPLPTPHAKGKSADLAKSTKVSKTGVKSEAAVVARKAKKSSAANSTADAGAKSTKSGKKAPVLADAKAKANATVLNTIV
uniref:Uncharacterized protein n=1 Tax=Zea mays TaxID=4577 RepID=A0A804UAH6_MAIZE